MNSGIYTLIIKLNKSSSISIGKLGKFKFPKGYYIYTGSAKRNLSQRIDRHNRKGNKKLRWHIDYLLNSRYAHIEDIIKQENPILKECSFNQKINNLKESKIIVKNFGSSDCRNKCPTHLIFFGEHVFNLYFIYVLAEKN